jgi:alkanesulfonate monooxygenase SsuD/methylene tetrahydromethanopterin reductase-like flavin-dependent oxidoreductase (luciferase family)
VTIKLGMFTMPFHHPDRDYQAILAEDQEAIVLADRLGFSEAFVGEHFSSWSEHITSPLMFFATLISRTKQIRFGTGVLKRALIIAGSPRRVLDQLVALRDETGHFGTLLMGGHDWDKPALWKRSMELLARDVMPQFSAHAAATPARV